MKIATKKYRTMKSKIILTQILFTLVIIVANAQNPILPITTERHNILDGAYIKDTNNDLDKFVGTWQYSQGNDEFTVEIQKIEMYTNDQINYFKDILVGKFKYIQNGVVIADYINSIDNQISGSILSFDNLNKAHLYLNDPQRKRINYNLELTYLRPGLQNPVAQLTWDLKITQIGWCGALPNRPAPSDEECRKDNRLPLNLTLEKQ